MLGIDIKTARKFTGLSNSTLYKMLREGELRRIKVRRRTYISVESLAKAFQLNEEDHERFLLAEGLYCGGSLTTDRPAEMIAAALNGSALNDRS